MKTWCVLRMIEKKNNPIHDSSVFKKLSLTLAESKKQMLWGIALLSFS
jgi:hypothetical protein